MAELSLIVVFILFYATMRLIGQIAEAILDKRR